MEGWLQAGELGLALVLSAVIGVEREIRQKNAGLRTHTLVGVGAALFLREAAARGSLSTMSRSRPPETSGRPPGSPWPLSGRW